MPLAPQPADTNRRVLQPPQFGLRTLFLAVTAVCVLLAVLKTMGPAWAAAVSMLLLLIAAHVIGNALGTRLRDGMWHGQALDESAAVELTAREEADRATDLPAARHSLATWQRPRTTRLQEKRPLGWVVIAVVVCGALLGGGLGGGAIASLYWDRIHFPQLAIAASASAIIGAIFALAASTFWNTVHRAWREAAIEAAAEDRRVQRQDAVR